MRWPERLAALALAAAAAVAQGTPDAAALYQTHCASCHGADRLGGMGPALVPENLGRLSPEKAARVIAEGRAATQMPAFGDRLGADEIEALARWIFAPPPAPPAWDAARIEATRRVLVPPERLAKAPRHGADPLNLFVVVELGDHHISILDGDRLEVIARLPTPRAVHGGPKFSPDGRFVYVASRDGWIIKVDLWGLERVAEVRAGINTRNLAVSDDGRYVMVGNYLPHTLVVLDAADLRPLRVIPVVGRDGTSSRVSAVYVAPPRGSFIAALKDVREIWEIPYSSRAEALPVYEGPMHDYRADSGEAPPLAEGAFPVRRIPVGTFLDDFLFDPEYRFLIGASRQSRTARVVHLAVGREIARIDLPGLPHLASGITWRWRGRRVMATPNLREGVVTVVDLQDWKVVRRISTLGPGFFLRSHEKSRYAWVDVFFGKDRDVVQVIDKERLEVAATLRPAPGKTAAHVEFDRHGRYALVSVWDMDGAVVVYDARTLQEVKRLPMRKPSGKYNVWNKITRSEGTSH
ncbi:nitrite reductase [Inmirania thermothiophila]|uniref:Mono/diheme cytochrome c family protein n=1 Tax=Inmirania thermothiophila TaxID=1750597 RepID=A0A3N1XSA8_9GAMM|nr:nitrite reductase [Inmirania thermothiophila]ROR29526.1 mono/diheme cytochrome c family protein [Inmirania thermothiophila]